eukprot:6195788-Pleurochrysis_carterae.AAC.1
MPVAEPTIEELTENISSLSLLCKTHAHIKKTLGSLAANKFYKSILAMRKDNINIIAPKYMGLRNYGPNNGTFRSLSSQINTT